jgi:predicted ATPase
VVIDEPELGLHPFALELLASLIHEASERTQVIVSTQSPLLLNQFEPEQVIVVDRLEGASRFQRLDVASLSHWLSEYSLGELLQKNIIEASPRYES